MNIFQQILNTRALSIIEIRAEQALALESHSDAEREALERILESNKLDEIFIICHEQLGEHEKAAKLRAWLSRKK